MKLLGDRQWQQVEPIKLASSQASSEEASHGIRAQKFNITQWIESQGVSLSTFVILVSMLALMVILFVIWMVWLYTDYKLNGHRLTEDAIQERLRLLRKLENEKYGKDRDSSSEEDSGNESDDETEPLKTKRKSAKH